MFQKYVRQEKYLDLIGLYGLCTVYVTNNNQI